MRIANRQSYSKIITLLAVIAAVVLLCFYRHWQNQQPSLRDTLVAPAMVDVYEPSPHPHQPDQNGIITGEAPVAHVQHRGSGDMDYKPRMILLLKTSKRFHSDPPTVKPNYAIDIFSDDPAIRLQQFEYVSATGELGRDHDWCYVPDEFRDWIKSLPVGRHHHFHQYQLGGAEVDEGID